MPETLKNKIQGLIVAVCDEIVEAEQELKSGDEDGAASRLFTANSLLEKMHDLAKQIST
jgi:hypothetical protein